MRRSPDEAERQSADDLLGLLTPVIKGYLTDKGFEAAVNAQQVLGGHGYIREHGMEQFVRDARITQIYEGTNGIQAMDLVGRKLPKDGGRAIRAFFETAVGRDIAERARRRAIRPALPRRSSPRSATFRPRPCGLPRTAWPIPTMPAPGAYAYMDLMGLVSLGWMWLKMAAASTRALDEGAGDRAFHETKLVTARFYAERELPLSTALRRKIEAGAETLMKNSRRGLLGTFLPASRCAISEPEKLALPCSLVEQASGAERAARRCVLRRAALFSG